MNKFYHDQEDKLIEILDGMPVDVSQERQELLLQLMIASDLRRTWDRRRKVANKSWKRVLQARRRDLAKRIRLRARA